MDCEDLESFLKPLLIDDDTLWELAKSFSVTYRRLAETADNQFLATPVTALPTGEETGRFLAIDVGGSNLRVSFIELLGTNVDGVDGLEALRHKNRSLYDKTPSKPQSQGDVAVSIARDFETLTPPNASDMPTHSRIRRKHEKAWPIEEHLKFDRAEDLFSWIGDCIACVVLEGVEHGDLSSSCEIPMGITFSFPMEQTCLSEATLMTMGKGFSIGSNTNLRSMLLQGYERHCISRSPSSSTSGTCSRSRSRSRRSIARSDAGSRRRLPKLKVVAITNDAVATLASLAYEVKSLPNSRVAMGLIVGTGCNATIPMAISSLHPTKTRPVLQHSPAATKVVVNTEWTISGAAAPLKDLDLITKWDDVLDHGTESPGFQPFEYMTSGRYLGELVRLVLVDFLTSRRRQCYCRCYCCCRRCNHRLASEDLEFTPLPALLTTPYAMSTTFLAQVVAKYDSDTFLANLLNSSNGNSNNSGLATPSSCSCTCNSTFKWDESTCSNLRRIAHVVRTRSAQLIAAAVIGLLGSTNELKLELELELKHGSINNGHDSDGNVEEELVVACTGGLIQQYPGFKDCCQRAIDALVCKTRRTNKSVGLHEAWDGGVIGAGVLAGTVDLSE